MSATPGPSDCAKVSTASRSAASSGKRVNRAALARAWAAASWGGSSRAAIRESVPGEPAAPIDPAPRESEPAPLDSQLAAGEGLDEAVEHDSVADGEHERDRRRQERERFLKMLEAGEVLPVPRRSESREVVIDEDHIYALINGEVITKKDILDGAVAYRLAMFDAQREAMSFPWRESISDVIDASARAEILQSFERKAIELVYRQEAGRLRDRLGSIPREHVDTAIEEAMKRHGIDVHDEEEARAKLQHVLQMTGMTFFDFERQVREQIEATRVAQYYAFAPHDRFGISFDISPAEMQEEYLERPIQRTEDVRLMRVRFERLSETAPEGRAIEDLARQFLAELRTRFDRIERRRANPEARRRARQETFAELAEHYLGEFDPQPEFLADLGGEPPEIAEEIRRTSPGALSDMVRMTNEVQVLYVIEKSQSGHEPFNSPAVQRELRQRLLNQRWNDFRYEVDMMLLRRAVMDLREPGVEFNPE